MRRLLLFVGLVLLIVSGATAYRRLTFDRSGWREDFAQLLDHTAKVYANLDSAPDRGVQPHQLKAAADEALARARTDGEAREAIAVFVRGFEDPHYQLAREKLSKRLQRWWRTLRAVDDESAVVPASLDGAEAAARLGFGARGTEPRFEFEGPAGRSLPPPRPEDAELPASLARLKNGKTLGILRIGSFSERSYPATAAATWERYRATLKEDCAKDCQEEFVYRQVGNALLAGISRRIAQLEEAQVDAIAVDLLGNGGGTSWAGAAARLFAKAPLPGERLAAARHPHWSERFAQLRDELDAALEAPALAEADRALLAEVRQRVDKLREEAATPCDRSGLWTAPGKPACSGVTQGELYATGLVAFLPPGALPDVEVRERLDNSLYYDYTPAVWQGPVFLLVDDGTASAAEQFAAMLLDGAGARAVGRRSVGAGCGYTNGGVPAKLRHSGLEVKMPDCARLRADGTNEIAGITPDVPVPWAEDTHERSEQLVSALTGALSAGP